MIWLQSRVTEINANEREGNKRSLSLSIYVMVVVVKSIMMKRRCGDERCCRWRKKERAVGLIIYYIQN